MPGTKRQPSKPSSTGKSSPVRRTAARAGTTGARSRSGTVAHAKAAPRKSSRRASSEYVPPRWSWSQLSLDRKLDIVGVVLALVGLLTLLSLVSTQHGALTGWWVLFVNQLAGWGSFILPVALILMGVWLVLRNVERLPMLSAERLVGVILLYMNVLAWLHLLSGGGWELAQAGQGGGFIGGLFEQLTVGALGLAGAYVAFGAWSLIAVALTLDISISELFNFFQRVLASLARRANAKLETNRQDRLDRDAQQADILPASQRPTYYIPNLDDPDGLQRASHDLPADFRPMADANRPAVMSVPADDPAAGLTGAAAARARAAARAQAADPSAAPAGSPAAARTTGRQAGANPAIPGSTAANNPAGTQPSVKLGGQTLPPWKGPVLGEILDAAAVVDGQINKDEELRRSAMIEETLASFGAPVKVVKVNTGPTVTQFGVEPLYVETRGGVRTRVRVSKIVTLADDLALALAASRIRIQAPVPGRNYVGIEVPNAEVARVALREVMESDTYKKIKSPMRFALGKDVSGHAKAYDLAGMPHLLIAGTTGSGKSVCVNSILTCLLINNTPNELRMILVDPKRVELTGYNGIPHLLSPVIVEAEEVIGALQWVQREMDARYHRFSQVGARNIVDYNARNSPALPYMLVLIDELADLMMLAPDETERALTRLAQLARATGIHLVLATQRPSVDVVTGLIKANFPARVAFAVASNTDSRVILDQPGAERLLGRGDMLFQAPDAASPVRLQGVYVSDAEIQSLVEYWRQQAYEMRNTNLQAPTAIPVNMDMPLNAPLKQDPLFGDGASGGDPIINDAIKIVREEGKASISMLQRRLRIGYTRAARLVDQLEERKIIGPSVPTSQTREVLDMGEKHSEVEDSTGREG